MLLLHVLLLFASLAPLCCFLYLQTFPRVSSISYCCEMIIILILAIAVAFFLPYVSQSKIISPVHSRMLNQESWRRPRGIDSRVRRNFKGTIPMVNIGYGNDKRTRHVLPNGLKALRVFNVKELEILIMHNRTFCAEIPHNVSCRKRKAIIDRADALQITVVNRNGKIDREDAE